MPATVAVFASVPTTDAPGATTTVTVAVAPLASAPIVHVTVAVPLQLPALVDDETKLTPAGSTSVSVTPAASFGPAFPMVYV